MGVINIVINRRTPLIDTYFSLSIQAHHPLVILINTLYYYDPLEVIK